MLPEQHKQRKKIILLAGKNTRKNIEESQEHMLNGGVRAECNVK